MVAHQVSNGVNIKTRMVVEAEAAREQVERLLRSKTFETSEAQRRLLQYLAEKTPSGEVPRYFQVVLGVEFKQAIPVRSSYVFHHALHPRKK